MFGRRAAAEDTGPIRPCYRWQRRQGRFIVLNGIFKNPMKISGLSPDDVARGFVGKTIDRQNDCFKANNLECRAFHDFCFITFFEGYLDTFFAEMVGSFIQPYREPYTLSIVMGLYVGMSK